MVSRKSYDRKWYTELENRKLEIICKDPRINTQRMKGVAARKSFSNRRSLPAGNLFDDSQVDNCKLMENQLLNFYFINFNIYRDSKRFFLHKQCTAVRHTRLQNTDIMSPDKQPCRYNFLVFQFNF